MNEIQQEALQVLVKLTLVSLRGCHRVSEDESSALDRLPAIDYLRKATESTDLSWLLPLVQSAPDPTAGLACSLVRHFIDEPGVAQSMMDRWEVAAPYLKNRIMWRLLEYGSLHDDWHDRFLEFVLEEWDVFNEFNRRFYVQSPEGVAQVQQRQDKAPVQKKWVYWLSLPSVITDASRLTGLFRGGLQNADDFSKKAIRAYQEKFGGN